MDAKEAEKPNNEEKGGKNKLILVVILVLVIGNGALAAIMLLGNGSADSGDTTAEETEPEIVVSDVPGTEVELDNFIVNLADEQRTYLRVRIAFELTPDADATTITDRVSTFRDRIITHLRTKYAEDLRSNEDMDELRNDLLQIARDISPNANVQRVLLTEFIVQ